MNTTPLPPPFRPVSDNAIDRLLESLKRKEPAPAASLEEDDLPLLTDIVHPGHAARLRPPVAPPPLEETPAPFDSPPFAGYGAPATSPPLEETPAPSPDDGIEAAATGHAAEVALQALEARVQELPRLIADALHNALPGITAEVMRAFWGEGREDRGQKTGD
ncbi:MAG: hypothetical protein LBF93_05030 [Zoogloeaceae bacterium]|jgi:hypothetical protein|nr:hypothetical protein [Zoogloeaceae bacterium]